MASHKTRVAQRGPFNLTQRTAVRAQNILTAQCQPRTRPARSVIVALRADDDSIQRKHDRLAGEMHDYFCNVCPGLTARGKQAMLTLPPSVLHHLSLDHK